MQYSLKYAYGLSSLYIYIGPIIHTLYIYSVCVRVYVCALKIRIKDLLIERLDLNTIFIIIILITMNIYIMSIIKYMFLKQNNCMFLNMINTYL